MPLAKYLFSDNSKEIQDQEVLIVLTPHIIRLPSITAANLRTMAAGTDTNVRVYRDDSLEPDDRAHEARFPARILRKGRLPWGRSDKSQAASAARRGAAAISTRRADVKPGDRTTLGWRFERERSLFDSAADSLQPGGRFRWKKYGTADSFQAARRKLPSFSGSTSSAAKWSFRPRASRILPA